MWRERTNWEQPWTSRKWDTPGKPTKEKRLTETIPGGEQEELSALNSQRQGRDESLYSIVSEVQCL